MLNFYQEQTYYTKFGNATAMGVQNYNLNEEIGFSVFPNPASNIFQIKYASSKKCKVELKIINTYGQTIYSETFFSLTSELRKEIDLGAQTKGIYIIEITTNNRKQVRKLVLK